MVRSSAQFVGDICRFRYFPSNDVIAKIALQTVTYILKIKDFNRDLPTAARNHSGVTCASKDSNRDLPIVAINHSGVTCTSKDWN